MEKKSKIINIIFIACFLLILVVPVCFMNFKPQQISEIENKTLAEWPGIGYTAGINSGVETYVDDRIGFREQAIQFYTQLNDKMFHVMVHPLFMYGKEGHIFYKDPSYITAYQRMNTDKPFLNSFVSFLKNTQDYLDSKDIKFLYFLCPDKKTIYSEYFPDTVNVNEDNTPVIDYMRLKLAEKGVNSIIPDTELLLAKQSGTTVYNKKYDATHWNDMGAFIGHGLIDKQIQEWFDDVDPLRAEDYNVEFVKIDSLDIAKFPIDEDVPVISRKVDNSADMTELLKMEMQCNTATFYTHYVNNAPNNGKILLVFTDSYFQAHQKYYNNRFKEVYFVHRQNYEYVQYFVNLVFPDMVIFETAERSISGEMPVNSLFVGYYYEPPFHGDGEAKEAENGLGYEIIGTSGARVEGNKIILDPNDGKNLVRIDGILNLPDDGSKYDVYVKTDDECMEADFCALHRVDELQGINGFSVNIQRRYMVQSHISLLAVNRKTNETYLLEDFEVATDE